jgi:hypothetical protein
LMILRTFGDVRGEWVAEGWPSGWPEGYDPSLDHFPRRRQMCDALASVVHVESFMAVT